MGSLSDKEEGCPEGGIRQDPSDASTAPGTVVVQELQRADQADGAHGHAIGITRSGALPRAVTAP
jgi:hypothetical protein